VSGVGRGKVFCGKFPRGQMEWLGWSCGKCFDLLVLIEHEGFPCGLMERLRWSYLGATLLILDLSLIYTDKDCHLSLQEV
jgi:hypothetical protein